jgi:hypothetical protein
MVVDFTIGNDALAEAIFDHAACLTDNSDLDPYAADCVDRVQKVGRRHSEIKLLRSCRQRHQQEQNDAEAK